MDKRFTGQCAFLFSLIIKFIALITLFQVSAALRPPFATSSYVMLLTFFCCQVIFNSSVFVLPDVSHSVLFPVDGHKRQPPM